MTGTGAQIEAAYLVLEGLSKSYGDGAPAVSGVDLVIMRGELVAFLGPSGCGKTTLLRMVAGLVAPSTGHILLAGADITEDGWEGLRTLFARRAPLFLGTALPGLRPDRVTFVPHHVAHAASAGLSVPEDSAVLVLDGRGEVASHLAGVYASGHLEVLRTHELPHSLGLLYEDLTRHLGFLHSSDEYKVMALAAYGEPRHLGLLRELVGVTASGGFTVGDLDWAGMAASAAVTLLVVACSVRAFLRADENLVDII